MLSLFKKKTVSTTERIYNWIQKHGNKQNKKMFVQVLRIHE